MKKIVFILCLALVVLFAQIGYAAVPVLPTNIALGKNVTGSGSYNSNYLPSKVVDGSTADFNNPLNYWLLKNHTLGWVEVDLGGEYEVGKVEFLNTHNYSYNDRSTEDWRIEILAGDHATINYSTSGTELDFNPVDPTALIPVTDVSLNSAVIGKYVKFYVDSYYQSGGGLNELRVYEAIPEPASLMLLGTGLIGLIPFTRKRKR